MFRFLRKYFFVVTFMAGFALIGSTAFNRPWNFICVGALELGGIFLLVYLWKRDQKTKHLLQDLISKGWISLNLADLTWISKTSYSISQWSDCRAFRSKNGNEFIIGDYTDSEGNGCKVLFCVPQKYPKFLYMRGATKTPNSFFQPFIKNFVPDEYRDIPVVSTKDLPDNLQGLVIRNKVSFEFMLSTGDQLIFSTSQEALEDYISTFGVAS